MRPRARGRRGCSGLATLRASQPGIARPSASLSDIGSLRPAGSLSDKTAGKTSRSREARVRCPAASILTNSMAPSSDPQGLIDAARQGDRRALAKLISVVENKLPGAEETLAQLYAATGSAWTTGITGAPGSGKSTLTDLLIATARERGSQVAVVAIDPSSPFTGGAILGDRVRMQRHIDDPGVYIRSMASRGHLGGIAEATPRAIAVLDGVGFAEIIVETVGVGQAEVEIAAGSDTTIVTLNPGWGDSIQAAKAGLLEIGDIFVVNKADRPGVSDTVRDLRQMLELGGHRAWWPPVVTTVATRGEGIEEVTSAMDEHRSHLENTGARDEARRRSALELLDTAVEAAMRERLVATRDEARWEEIRAEVADRKLDPWTAATLLVGGDSSRR